MDAAAGLKRGSQAREDQRRGLVEGLQYLTGSSGLQFPFFDEIMTLYCLVNFIFVNQNIIFDMVKDMDWDDFPMALVLFEVSLQISVFLFFS